jgi:hypothetical protein
VNRRLRAGVDGGTRVVPEPETEPEPETTDVGRVGDMDLRGQGLFLKSLVGDSDPPLSLYSARG